MTSDATESYIQCVVKKIESIGLKAHPIPGANRTAIGITGNSDLIDPALFTVLPGVAECMRITKPYKLVGRDLKHDKTVIRIGEAEIGGDNIAIIAGVCAIESREQAMLTAQVSLRWAVDGFAAARSNPALPHTHFRGWPSRG